eukprot:TRINITY_DN5031_c0_g1_i1.p1 TRINITY_DN5031_c0_g1~~TRINITY_DN5031_c0_g1_i1.p1  ORF type:complete len:354 (-),score=20.64 TRINITY_DN5031_c0_g1_i1:228-1289(-)
MMFSLKGYLSLSLSSSSLSSSHRWIMVLMLYVLAFPFLTEGKGLYYKWVQAHATFYGGADASGTMGGACGYGDLYSAGYGMDTAAASSAIFADGFACGGCYEVQCLNAPGWSYCLQPSRTVTITITNLCPNNWALPSDAGGWCNFPRKHFDMSQPVFEKIAQYGAGIVPVQIRRVPCSRQGGIVFILSGNPYFLEINIQNVAGPGDLESVYVRYPGSSWLKMAHNWGAVYSYSGFMGYQKPLDFRLMSMTGNKRLIILGAVKGGWNIGDSVQTYANFPMPRWATKNSFAAVENFQNSTSVTDPSKMSTLSSGSKTYATAVARGQLSSLSYFSTSDSSVAQVQYNTSIAPTAGK